MRRIIDLVVLIAIFAAVLVFTIMNIDHHTAVTLWPGYILDDVLVPVVVGVSFGVGVLVTLVPAGLEVLKRNMQLRACARRIRTLEAERDELRNLPLKEELRATAEEERPAPHPSETGI